MHKILSEVNIMARTGSIMWDMFMETGNIDVYVKYKKHSRLKESKEEKKCLKPHSNSVQ